MDDRDVVVYGGIVDSGVFGVTIEEFKSGAAEAGDAIDVDALCLAWLRDSASEQPQRMRDILLMAIDLVRVGFENA